MTTPGEPIRPSSRLPRPASWVWGVWAAVFAVVTVGMLRARTSLELTDVVLVYVLVVLGGSATGPRMLGFALAALGFGAIDYWFQTPYGTLTVAKPLDWLALITFLATAIVTTQLLSSARAREAEALEHAREVTRMARELEHAEALRAADRFRETLVASVSHDFRTPLTTIKALADDVAASTLAARDTDVESNARIIAEQADRLAGLVDNILDLSRIRAGSLPVNLEINTAEDLIGAATRQMRPALADHPIEVDIDWSTPALVGRFDFGHALRALCNLIENAAKYSTPGSPITLTVRRHDGQIAIAVADRGIGIAAAEREQIFEPFYRPTGMPPDTGGAGLGLAIARQLAVAVGGSVVYAPRPGGGSVFTLTLPAAGDDLDVLEPPSA